MEDPVYQSLMEKIIAKRSLLKKEFEKADRNRTSISSLKIFFHSNYISFFFEIDHLSATVWSDIMKNVLQIDLPWLTLRSILVKEDTQGILYNSMLEGYALDNAKFQNVRK